MRHVVPVHGLVHVGADVRGEIVGARLARHPLPVRHLAHRGGDGDGKVANALEARVDAPLRQLIVGKLRREALRRGKANKIIAYELSISESTVKAHVTAILRKLNLRSRIQAALYATRQS